MASEIFTKLETPPEYRGGPAEAYAIEVSRWVKKYHLMLVPQLKDALQRLANINGVATLTQSISNPPTQGEVQAIQAKINEVINAAVGT